MPTPIRSRAPRALALLLPLAMPAALLAQEPLVGARTATGALVIRSWSFGGGLADVDPGDPSRAVRVTGATQLALPFRVDLPFGEMWSVDVSGAFAHGSVALKERDADVGASRYAYSGIGDLRLRAVGRLAGDAVLVTLGASLPGATGLDREQLAAMRVLASPALRMPAAMAGTATSANSGIVVAREVKGWALASGLAFELRQSYAPTSGLVAGAGDPDFDPGDILRASLGADGFIGGNQVTVGAALSGFSEGRLRGAGTDVRTRLGPVVSVDASMALAAPRFSALTVYLAERYRAPFTRDGASVAGSRGNEIELGAHGVLPVRRSVSATASAGWRHNSGLRVDETIATAGITSLALGGGMEARWRAWMVGSTLGLEMGRIRSGGDATGARALVLGITGGRTW